MTLWFYECKACEHSILFFGILLITKDNRLGSEMSWTGHPAGMRTSVLSTASDPQYKSCSMHVLYTICSGGFTISYWSSKWTSRSDVFCKTGVSNYLILHVYSQKISTHAPAWKFPGQNAGDLISPVIYCTVVTWGKSPTWVVIHGPCNNLLYFQCLFPFFF